MEYRIFKLHIIAVTIAGLYGFSVHAVFANDTINSSDSPITQEDAKNPLPSPTSERIEFATEVLELKNKQSIDLRRFSSGNYSLPGKYQAGIWINDSFLGNQDIEVKEHADGSSYVCITPDLLKILPLSWDRLSEYKFNQPPESTNCSDVLASIPDSRVTFDSGEQRLDVAIPQKFIIHQARGSVSPDLWDSGISAAFLSYNMNSWASQSRGYDYKSLYTSVNSGMNIGAWYFRHNGSYTWSESGEKDYQSINTYAQRDILSIKGRLLIGQSNTTGRLFDTVPFSGVQLASDERMYPSSQRGYAPEIHGIAKTHAKVTVRQNSVVIYETTVSPGEFVIDDLYPTGFGGDLTVNIHEADGQERYFIVPFASTPQLLRPGSYRYSFTGGKLRQISLSEKPQFYEATWQHGLTNFLSGYLGWQQSENYYAAQAGLAVGSLAGSLSFDITQSHATFDKSGRNTGPLSGNDSSSSGQSYRLSYSKLIQNTGTSINLAAYRFSTEGYYDFTTAMMTREAIKRGYDSNVIKRAKSRYTLSVNQSLAESLGQLYASASLQKYWNSDDSDKQYQLGYSNHWKLVSYGISVSRSYSWYGKSDTSWMASVSFPLGNVSEEHTPNIRFDAVRTSGGHYSESASISGNAGVENQCSYGVTASNAGGDTGSSLFVNGQWRTPYTYLSGSNSNGRNYRSQSLGASGSLIAHSGGVTLSPYISDTWALVEAKGAKGARVSSYPGVMVDRFGYAAVPYLNAYELNEVAIDPNNADNDVGFENTSRKVAPYSGAIVKVKYDTQTGVPVLIDAGWKGQPIPFGADVIDESGNYMATAGQAGQIFTRLEPGRHVLKLKAGSQGSCSLPVEIPETVSPSNLLRFKVTCL
ncbi:fimbrial biogenesis outer membrane usher protein [Escherichia coli]|uniref:fimbria/pilus outer membrane usher protein n=1 Tax=Escherichia coli TaxID=562 RepID=UPI001355DE2A|nr:fimbria/pilus outer membrane usher protein [Escherichia coli]EHH6606148.1 fimbrial biogenesis outer membrane usher protein [Escherichia coli]MWM71874.1 fimbria/pilus outer membrane usher protein [Escherichia coli]HAH9783535.1 fimbrial biogenesis outer membrane usher protein [Escherichia coli]HAW1411499.1 fimbrial biogenesis outer membrane usher protein [Escherichia coli]